MSKFAWLALVQEQPHHVLDAKARAVAAALVMEAERDALSVAAGIAALVKRSALADKSVKRALADLERDCWLVVRRDRSHKGQSRRVTNTYRFTIPGWARTVGHSDPRSAKTMGHSDPRSQEPERTTIGHSDPLLRGKYKESTEPDPQPAPDAPLRGQAIRDILTRRHQPQSVTAATPPALEADHA